MADRKTAEQFFNNGVSAANDRSAPEYLQHAFQMFSSAVYADPTWATAAYQCGNNASDLLMLPTAIACWRRALECEMPDVGPHDTTDASRAKVLCNLGWRLESVGQTAEALKATEEAVEPDPKLAFAWLNMSIILGRLGSTQASVGAARKAFELSPEDPTVEMGLAFALLFNRDLAEGFKHFESRYAYRLKNFQRYPYPKWLGEPDKTVFLVSDQGLGDTLSMARFVRAACKRARYVHACVHPELLRLLQYALMDVPNLNLLPQPCNFPAADVWTTFVSLPFALGLSDDEIRNAPQITFKPERTNAKQWRVPDRKLHIGIAWRGSSLNEINEHRSIPVTQFLDLYKVPGVQLYSLQVDQNKHQMHDAGCSPVIKDLSGYISDVTSTVAILQDLDLVITIESALGHICTLAGVETWVPYSKQGKDYRVGFDGKDQIWSKYRVFCQDDSMTWQPVFDEIVTALQIRADRERVK
ncbi:MAG: tetratricopeptide repeat protein [Hyphomicrobium sp.]|jgi:tetratricopeptide (TPR) repeat protein